MKSLSLPAMVMVMLLSIAATAQADEIRCVDGRVARLACQTIGKVMTSYGCDEVPYGIRCADAQEIPAGEIYTAGGFRRVPGWEAIRLFRDGTVKTFSQERGSPIVEKTVLKVEAPQMARILDSFSKAQPGTLSTDENRPMCMDAPSTTYSVYVIDGPSSAKVDVGAVRGCRPFYSNGEGAWNARNVLSGLESFVRFLE